jgi:hypothetical protein
MTTTPIAINPNPWAHGGRPAFKEVQRAAALWMERVLHPLTIASLRDSPGAYKRTISAFATAAKYQAGCGPAPHIMTEADRKQPGHHWR